MSICSESGDQHGWSVSIWLNSASRAVALDYARLSLGDHAEDSSITDFIEPHDVASGNVLVGVDALEVFAAWF
jgi:hypothetical protein